MSPEQYARTAVRERHRGFVTNLPLATAIERIHAYQVAYKTRYLLAVEFSLIGVVPIDDLDAVHIHMCDVELVEALPQHTDAF
ncbi:hypothetical protein [Methylogaea oryzae]|nr:hypothetical protein [Methylogaea oryzae]